MSVKELRSQAEIDNFIKNNANAIVFFGTISCGHCVAANPVYANLAGRFPHVKFGHVEVSKVQTEQFRGYPAFGFYTNGHREMLFGANRLEEMIVAKFGNDISRNPRILNSAVTREYRPTNPTSPRNNVIRETPKPLVNNSRTRSPIRAELPRSARKVSITREIETPRSPRTAKSSVVAVRSNVRANPRI